MKTPMWWTRSVMSRNAVTHGLTAEIDRANVDAWLDVITCEGSIAPKDCHEAVGLAEAEVRLRAAVTHWRHALFEAGKPFEATETAQQFDAMISQIRDISNVTGEPIDREGLRLLKSIEREALKAREGPLRDLRLASRYLAEALSQRRRRLDDWIAYLGAISRNENISPIGGVEVASAGASRAGQHKQPR